jgi:pimeloyl-ACP methyl ester carboxylesterase
MKPGGTRRAAIVASMSTLLSACSMLRPLPTLPFHPGGAVSHPVVIIPGILGSKLEDTRNGRVVWGKLFNLRALTVHESLVQPSNGGYDGVELPIASTDFREDRDNLVPTTIMDSFAIIPHIAEVKVYRRLLEALAVCGYRPGAIQSCGLNANAGVFAYDWRRDIVETAQALAARIREIQANTGRPDTRVDIVAHSMGGLVAEYYLLYGGEDVLDRVPLPPPSLAGAANVRRLILLGTPNEGSLEALRDLHVGYRVGLTRVSNLATFTMPALYELLPSRPEIRRVDADGTVTDVDLFELDTWRRYGLGVFSPRSRRVFLRECQSLFPSNWRDRSKEISAEIDRFLGAALTRAQRLHEALAPFAGTHLPTEVYVIGSASRATLEAAELRADAPGWKLTFGSSSWGCGSCPLPPAPGDGTVTASSLTWGRFGGNHHPGAKPSGAAPIFPTTWVDAEHERLPANDEVLARVVALLAASSPTAPPP